jgi:hypothetical protein
VGGITDAGGLLLCARNGKADEQEDDWTIKSRIKIRKMMGGYWGDIPGAKVVPSSQGNVYGHFVSLRSSRAR